jgi:hypothetical protein
MLNVDASEALYEPIRRHSLPECLHQLVGPVEIVLDAHRLLVDNAYLLPLSQQLLHRRLGEATMHFVLCSDDCVLSWISSQNIKYATWRKISFKSL